MADSVPTPKGKSWLYVEFAALGSTIVTEQKFGDEVTPEQLMILGEELLLVGKNAWIEARNRGKVAVAAPGQDIRGLTKQ
jgi:hypothetical protein